MFNGSCSQKVCSLMSLNVAFSVKSIHFGIDYIDNRDCVCFLEYKKARQEIKKKSSDTLKLQKKAKKGNLLPTVLLKPSELCSLTEIKQ